jgi:hypothetical protein
MEEMSRLRPWALLKNSNPLTPASKGIAARQGDLPPGQLREQVDSLFKKFQRRLDDPHGK